MKKLPLANEAVLVLTVFALGACATGASNEASSAPGPSRTTERESAPDVRIVQPGAPGEATRTLSRKELPTNTRLPHTDADVEFMQGMIPHHAQALDMAALVEERTQSQDIRLLAKRIEISQRDEIALMSRWLEERGEEVPGQHAHHMMEGHLMPGMLTAADMAELAGARGADFDRLFLEHMIRHHEGAIVMVKALFASPGAGQETDMFTFASHVDADQQIEIRRMKEMLAAGR